MPKENMDGIIEANLDGYINLYYRSFKNHRDGNLLSSHLDGVESIPYLLTAIFALNGRMRPYNKYFEWELRNYPIEKTAWSAEDLTEKIEKILSSGDIETQKGLYRDVKRLFCENGFHKAIDGWSGYNLW